jgi:nicotinamidase-related amidase
MPSDIAADPGHVSERCARCAANDAYMRDFRLVVPRDCTVSNTQQQNDSALDQIRVVLKADVRPAAELDLESLVHPSGE